MTITLFDIPASQPNQPWSPNTWKVRYCLNYKHLPYKTEWIEYPDIEGRCIELGIQPTSKKDDGSPFYTLPAIHDASTGLYISDSFAIAEYLEKTYPHAPNLFPNGTAAFQTTFEQTLIIPAATPTLRFLLPVMVRKLSPRSQEHFRRTKEEQFGSTLEAAAPIGEEAKAEWAKLKEGLDHIDSLYAKTGGPFLMGDLPSWADFVTGSWIIFWRAAWGAESTEWIEISGWNNGRWQRLLDEDVVSQCPNFPEHWTVRVYSYMSASIYCDK